MHKRDLKYIFLIVVTFIAACVETDIFLPALADMLDYFSTSEEKIQSLLSWNFFGICVSGPLYGPLSDAWGRRKPLLVALGLFFVGSLLTLFAPRLDLMLVGRVLQGLGSGGCFTLGTAIIFDVFREERAVKVLSQINSIVPFIMAGAPLLGGYLNQHYGFRSNFVAIAVLVLLCLLTCLLLFDESLEEEKRSSLEWKKVLSDFGRALCCLPFMSMSLVVSLLFSAYMVFLSTAALLFIIEYGVDKEVYPFFQGAVLGAWLLASLLCSPCLSRWGASGLKKRGISLLASGGVLFVSAALLAPENPYFLTLAMMLIAFGFNWSQAVLFPEAMELLPDIKGVTASLLTSTRLMVTGMIIAGAARLYNGTVYPLAAVIGALIAISLFLLWFNHPGRKTVPAQAY